MGSLRGPCLRGSSVCGTPAWDVSWALCLPCPPSCVMITAYTLGSFSVCRCTGSTVHVCVCLYSSVFALAGPSFTAVTRGHKSLGEGKSMKSMCMYLKMVMGGLESSIGSCLFMSEQLLTGFTGPAVFVETWQCVKSAGQHGRHWPRRSIEVHSNEMQSKFQVLAVTTLQVPHSPVLLTLSYWAVLIPRVSITTKVSGALLCLM